MPTVIAKNIPGRKMMHALGIRDTVSDGALSPIRLMNHITEEHFDAKTRNDPVSARTTLQRLRSKTCAHRVQKTFPDTIQRALETNVVICVAKPRIASDGEGPPD